MEKTELERIYAIEKNNWWYLSRKNIMHNLTGKELENRSGLKILDIASACGMNFNYFREYGDIYGIDISPESINFCKTRGITRIVQGNALNLPYKNNVFDSILAFDALEHFNDDLAALNEFNRVLKHNSKIFITVPALSCLYSSHDRAYHHFRRYSKKELIKKLNICGFKELRITYWSFMLLPLVFTARKIKDLLKRQEKTPRSDFFIPIPGFINHIFGFIQQTELRIIDKGINYPIGVSLACAAIKTKDRGNT